MFLFYVLLGFEGFSLRFTPVLATLITEEHALFNAFKSIRQIVIPILLFILLAASAVAESPVCTVTYAKEAYMPGETITAHYQIDFSGTCSSVFIEWCIIADWETWDIQAGDSYCEMSTAEGDLTFTPAYGEGAVPYFTLITTDGGYYDFWGDPIRITTSSTSKPVFTVDYDKGAYAPGETINAHYHIAYDGGYTALYAEWNIIADWETGDILSGDSFHTLSALKGDLSFTPEHGEGAILYFTLIDADGKQHNFWSEPVQITGSAVLKPQCTVTFDQDAYASGETILAHYQIHFSGAYTALYAEWNVITDWETGALESGDDFHELTSLEGDLSFTPARGEGAVLYFTLIEPDGKWHALSSEPVQITQAPAAEPTFTVVFDKDACALGETVHAHYQIDYDGEYTALYAEWNVIADWETGDIQPGDSYHELTALKGDLSFTPHTGEGLSLYLTLVKANGRSCSYLADPIRISTPITTLPKALTAIEDEAFAGAPFARVACPQGLLTIGSRAFAGCKNLQSITIPASVTSIADDAFEGCSPLTIITPEGSVAEAYALRHGHAVLHP